MTDATKTTGRRTELHMARSMCWHCQSEVTGEYFCDHCVKLQPLSKELDYFTCLGLPRRLTIDPQDLETRFYRMSRSFHPDFYQNKSDTEQTISLGNSALLNIAYRTLKDPILRAEYLVHLEAGSAKDIRTSPPADLFEEILSLQEDLEAFRALPPTGKEEETARLRTKLAADRDSLEAREGAMDRRLTELFAAWDRTADTDAPEQKAAVLKDLRDLLSNRTYLRNIITDLVATTA